MWQEKDVINHLQELGFKKGDVVLMHSSYKSLGEIEGGAKTLFSAFDKVLGEEGTLVLPTLTFATVSATNRYFNVQETKSNVGYLSEYFRTQVEGVVRSSHITHSVAVKGKYAEFLISGHEKDQVMVGENSPFVKLPSLNAKILFLGCKPSSNTLMHGVETVVKPPYLFYNATPLEYIYQDGEKTEKRMLTRFTFGDTKTSQRYDRMLNLLTDEECIQGRVCDAHCYVLSAKAVWEKGLKKIKENPFYFVDSPLDPNNND